jgi:apolipoprotein N-acyltransferase
VVYTKQRPVPFGEFLPYRNQISDLSDKFALLPRDFVAGTESGQITVKGVRLGMVICFEVTHDDVVDAAVRDGGEVLVVLTNNATYATTDQPEQQFDVTRQRAVEFARPVVVAATTGISASIDAQGNVTRSLAQNRGGYFVTSVQGSGQMTPQARYGVVLELFFVMLAILAIAIRVIIRPIRNPEDRTEQETS